MATPRPAAPETRRAYDADWATFETACRRQGVEPLLAAPGVVAAHLAGLAATHGAGGLVRAAAAINQRHRSAGLPAPGADPAVKTLLAKSRAAFRLTRAPGLRPSDGGAGAPLPIPAQRPRAVPPGPAQLTRMAANCGGDLAGLRDRALLLLTAAGIDPVLLLGLEREHVRLTDIGAELALGIPADDSERRLTKTPVRRAVAVAGCPVRALDAWLRASDTRFGPVFRKVDRWGNVEHAPLGVGSLRLIWQRRAQTSSARRRRTETGGGTSPPAPDLPSSGA